jgi:hypothetical protein
MNAAKCIWSASLFLCLGYTSAQEKKDVEEAAVIEIGAASSRNLQDHASSFGPTVAVEITPVENWLELEAGLTPSFGRNATEWGVDLLFKKPWTLSPTVEFMVGIGPEWIQTRESGATTNAPLGRQSLISCSGPSGGSTNSAVTSSPAMNTSLDGGMSDPSV